jgi:hypothetical protein
MARAGSKAAGIGMAIALVLALAPAAAASTESAGGYRYATKAVGAKPGKRVSASVACPNGTRVIGGGERNSGGFGSIELGQTFPYDDGDKGSTPDDGWRIRARNLAAGPVQVRVTAVCGDTKLRYRHDRFQVATGTQTGDSTVSCPGGTSMYAGGVEAGAKSKLTLNSTFPESSSTNEWGTYVDNPGTATHATVHVVCGKRQPEIINETLNDIPGGPAEGVEQASCPNHRFPLGGGVSNTAGYHGVAINSLGPMGTEAWGARLDRTAPFSPDMTVSVLCGKPLN